MKLYSPCALIKLRRARPSWNSRCRGRKFHGNRCGKRSSRWSGTMSWKDLRISVSYAWARWLTFSSIMRSRQARFKTKKLNLLWNKRKIKRLKVVTSSTTKLNLRPKRSSKKCLTDPSCQRGPTKKPPFTQTIPNSSNISGSTSWESSSTMLRRPKKWRIKAISWRALSP